MTTRNRMDMQITMRGVPLDAQRLRECLIYDPATGVFAWTTGGSPHRRRRPGSAAGAVLNNGYIKIKLDGGQYLAHRLAWLFMTGEWPADQVDHINGERDDNRWGNLRLATNGQNKANSRIAKNNTSGFKGVSWNKRVGAWQASVCNRLVGNFPTAESAHEAYRAEAERVFGEFARAA